MSLESTGFVTTVNLSILHGAIRCESRRNSLCSNAIHASYLES